MSSKEKQILDAALKLFIETGIQGTPTALIAKKAGVSNGTLFHYFHSKDRLIEALYHGLKKEQISFVLRDLDKMNSVEEKLKNIWDQWIHWGMKNDEAYQYCTLFEHSTFFNKNADKINKPLIEELDILLEQGIQQKILTFMQVDLLFELTHSNVQGMSAFLKKNMVKYRTPEFMRNAFSYYWKSIQA